MQRVTLEQQLQAELKLEELVLGHWRLEALGHLGADAPQAWAGLLRVALEWSRRGSLPAACPGAFGLSGGPPRAGEAVLGGNFRVRATGSTGVGINHATKGYGFAWVDIPLQVPLIPRCERARSWQGDPQNYQYGSGDGFGVKHISAHRQMPYPFVASFMPTPVVRTD